MRVFNAQEYIEFVISQAKARRESLGPDFDVVDFFVGAMVTFFFFDKQDEIPAYWIVAPMSGRDIIEEYDKM